MIAGLIFILLFTSVQSDPQNSGDQPLHALLQKVEAETGYRLLYRDALVAGKSGRLNIDDSWKETLLDLLGKHGLDASVNEERKQIVIFRRQKSPPEVRNVRGVVIDRDTGEQLPLATVRWSRNGDQNRGVQTDLQGRFNLTGISTGSSLTIGVSYVGYRPVLLAISPAELQTMDELAIRLEPSAIEITEIVVSGNPLSNSRSDSIYRGMLDTGMFSPVGEPNTIRMLQMLPAVAHGSSLLEGSYVRGSNSDAMNVLLDGSVIYNQTHLFGLIDSFNADVIRTGSFYYDIAPARYQAPPGGVLNLITKTGSLHDYGGSFGFSNSVIRGSIEGPLSAGRASWLLAGRHSILNQVDIFDNAGMVSWGLDIDRKSSRPEGAFTLEERIVTPLDFSASFYDLHGKIFFEGEGNSRWTFSGYLGGDDTSQENERIIRASLDQTLRRFDRGNFETLNRWGNRSFSITHMRDISPAWSLTVNGGYSYYYTRYLKEDFIYQRPSQANNSQLFFVNDFENESELNHGYVTSEIQNGNFSAGLAINMYSFNYLENSFNRPEFFQRSRTLMPELFAEYNFYAGELLELQSGIRLHHYSDGSYTNVSPRLRVTFFPDNRISFGAGFTRNHQFLYRLAIYKHTTSDIWISATEGQPPAVSDNLSAGIYLHPWRSALLQAEGYLKWQKNLRFHEINIQNLQSPTEQRPWFFDNDGFSRGLEIMFRQGLGRAEFIQSYTISSSELRNERLNAGEWFYAEWDRQHRFNTILTWNFTGNLKTAVNWIYSTGRPDRLELFSTEPGRLGHYSRVDLSITYSRNIGSERITLQAGVYNLLDRNNPWYREWVQVVDDSRVRPQLVPVEVDVYDLGFRPSFTVGVYF